MLTKDSFMSSCKKIPFAKTKIEGLGECGVILFREGEFEEFSKLTPNEQIANSIIGNDGERVFSDDDIQSCIVEKMTQVTKRRVIDSIADVNGWGQSKSEIKKN